MLLMRASLSDSGIFCTFLLLLHSGVDKDCLTDLQCQNLSGISIRVRAGTDHVADFGTTVGIVLCLTNHRHVKIGHE
jgi:hypothetical protein